MPYKNKKIKKEYDKEFHRNNYERAKKYRIKYMAKDPEKYKKIARENAANWRKKNPEKYKEILKNYWAKNKEKCLYLKRYSISKEDFQNILKKQNNVCVICKNKDERSLSVDHDHKTNKNRGLLCRKCNIGLGFFNDDIKLLKEAIKYLESYKISTMIE